MRRHQVSLKLVWTRIAFRKVRKEFLEGLADAMQTPNSSTLTLLRTLSERTPDQSIAKAYRVMRERLGRGMSIGAALAPFFPREEQALIAAADQSAQTDIGRGRSLASVAKLIGSMSSVQSGMYGVLAQAVGSLIVIAFVWLGLGLHIGAEFGRALPRDRWPSLSAYVIGAGEAVVASWPIAVTVVLGLVVAGLWVLPNWTGRARRWADQHVPGFVLYRILRSSPRLLTLGGYLAAGLGFRGAISQMLASANPWERMYLEEMATRLKSKLSVDIVDVGYFSWESMVQIDMRSQGGEIAAAMQDVAIASFPAIERSLNQRSQRAKWIVSGLQMVVVSVVVLSVALLYSATVTSFGANF